MAAKRLIIVTGLAGAGKTVMADRIVAARGESAATVVRADNFRYVPGTWTKVPLAEFAARIEVAIATAPTDVVVYDSTYHDAHDPEDAKAVVMRTLLSRAIAVVILKTDTVKEQLCGIVGRSLRRAAGAEPQGAAVETPESVVALILKSINNFDANQAQLQGFAQLASAAHVPVHIGGQGMAVDHI